MTNEHGARLDNNGYAESIIQSDTGRCYLCGKRSWKLDRHEPFGGALRQKSKAYGMWVSLCHCGCHEGPGSVHDCGEKNRELRKDAQRAAMLRYGWTREEFILRYGKSELTEEEAKHLILTEESEVGLGERVSELLEEIFPQRGSCFSVLAAEMPF